MFCHQCGAAIDGPDDRFCSRCGAQLHREAEAVSGPQTPPAEAPASEDERLRRPISAWPNRPRERIQLPLTELRQRRARETGDAVPLPALRNPVLPEPAEPASAKSPAPSQTPVEEPPVAEEAPTPLPEPAEQPGLDLIGPEDEPEEISTSRSRAEAALRRMVPPKDLWVNENQPGPAERGRVRDEWPTRTAPTEIEANEIPPEEARPAPARDEPPVEDPIIPWLEPPVLPAEPPRPAPPSREARAEDGPIIVPRDYTENAAARGRKGRRRAAPKSRGPLFDPAALGRSIKPSWILAIAGVILLTLIVFAMFPPGGGGTNETSPDRINKFTGMPVHTISTPVRPTGAADNETIAAPTTTGRAGAGVPTIRAWTTTTTVPRSSQTGMVARTPTGTAATGAPGIQVVIASTGGWSGTIGQQGETYTETPVAGRGTQTKAITGPARMVTVNIQKLEATADSLEVRVERDGAALKQGSTTDPNGIVALSVEV